jgi:hypothetical protein
MTKVGEQGPRRPRVAGACLRGAAGVALVLQLFAVLEIGMKWAGYYDVRDGGCGWDGTCSQAGGLPLSVWCLLALVIIEVAVGLVRQSIKWLAVAIIAGCITSMAIAIQSLIVDYNASIRYPGVLQTPDQAKFFFTCNMIALASESLLILLGWILVLRRRLRSATSDPRPGA